MSKVGKKENSSLSFVLKSVSKTVDWKYCENLRTKKGSFYFLSFEELLLNIDRMPEEIVCKRNITFLEILLCSCPDVFNFNFVKIQSAF